MKTNFISRLMLVLAIVLLVCLLLDFLAFHDIHNDYVSKAVISRFPSAASGALPDWTDTSGEWAFADISYIIKLMVAVLMIIISVPAIRTIKKPV